MNYTKSKNNYFAIPKDNPKDKIELVIGDDKQVAFYPQKKIKRWDNEVNCSIRLVHDEKTPTFRKDPDKVVWTGEKVEAHFYDIEPNEEHPEGASEFEVFLKEKPATNVVSFTVVDKGVEYFYQPEITDEEVTEYADRRGLTIAEAKVKCQPENVIGSYAIYAKEYKHNVVGGKEYKCGKVGHIYRPQIEDANGVKVWGELKIDKGLLTVTIPQEFLDNATYPVRHAAGLTFGYTTIGTGFAVGIYNIASGAVYALSEAGTVASITACVNVYAGTAKFKWALFDTSNNKIAQTNEVTRSSTPYDWLSSNLTAPSVLSAGNYYLWAKGDPDGSDGVASDSASNISRYESMAYASAFPATIVSPTTSDKKMSIYATYTASGGSSAIKTINGLAKASCKTWNGLAIASVKSINGLQ